LVVLNKLLSLQSKTIKNNIMNRERRFEILELVKFIQEGEPTFSIQDSIFALWKQNQITVNELEYLINWLTI
jgi:hypothetical protein